MCVSPLEKRPAARNGPAVFRTSPSLPAAKGFAACVSPFAACAAVLVLLSGVTLAADADLDLLMATLAQRKHGHVTFTERKFLAVLDRPVESSGELVYDAPDHLEKRTVKPKPESLVLEGETVTAQRGRHKYVLDLKQYPQVVPFIESIRATLAGDRAALERVFKLSFDGSLAHWTLDLAPLDPKLAATVKRIRIVGEGDAVRTVEIAEADGDHSLLTIGPEVGP
jgi:outer membrane lipoprotein-sorting protein